MAKTVNRFDSLNAGLCSELLKKYDTVELQVHEDHETFNLSLVKGKKFGVVHLSGELITAFEHGEKLDLVLEEIDGMFKEASKA